ncbi:MAG: FGGY-family carbohydrate kinase [Chloroflexi bacterium]|nr:FGGY-family carbohydrate kinase [Chloroflexota bacterium]
MFARYLLVIDLGTSKVRCALVDARGRIVSMAARALTYQTPQEVAPLGREFSAQAVWALVRDVAKEAMAKGGAGRADVIGVSATSQRLGVVFLDEAGEELYAGPNLDLRALMEGLAIDEAHNKAIFTVTGHLPSFLFAPAKLKWFLVNRPDIFNRIRTALPIADWLIYKLTGERAGEASLAVETGLADARTGDWAEAVFELLSLPCHLGMPLLQAGTRIGGLKPGPAGELGLSAGTPVAAGGPDTQCGLLGMGVAEPGQAGVVVGWSAPVQLCTAAPVFDVGARIWTGLHMLPERWILESSATEAGNAYRWLVSLLFSGDDPQRYAAAEALAGKTAEAADGSMDALALLGPSTMNMGDLRLRFGGMLFPLPLSVMSTDKGHLLLATLENVAFAIKANLDQVEEISGARASRLALGGGLAQSAIFGRLLADALGRPIEVASTPEVSTIGAAMCAAVGAGAYPTLRDACAAMACDSSIVEPGTSAHDEALERYERWLVAGRHLDQLSVALG